MFFPACTCEILRKTSANQQNQRFADVFSDMHERNSPKNITISWETPLCRFFQLPLTKKAHTSVCGSLNEIEMIKLLNTGSYFEMRKFNFFQGEIFSNGIVISDNAEELFDLHLKKSHWNFKMEIFKHKLKSINFLKIFFALLIVEFLPYSNLNVFNAQHTGACLVKDTLRQFLQAAIPQLDDDSFANINITSQTLTKFPSKFSQAFSISLNRHVLSSSDHILSNTNNLSYASPKKQG